MTVVVPEIKTSINVIEEKRSNKLESLEVILISNSNSCPNHIKNYSLVIG